MTEVYWAKLTARGITLRSRSPLDFYPTPMPFVQASLAVLPKTTPHTILDVGAGLGVWGKVARDMFPEAHIAGVEINPDMPSHPAYNEWITTDFNTVSYTGKFDIVMGNPPFNQAMPFVEKGLKLLTPTGRLIFLMRLAFLESQRRYPFFMERPPLKVHVFSKRPSFTGDGKTDSTAYALFTWASYTAPTGLDWIMVR